MPVRKKKPVVEQPAAIVEPEAVKFDAQLHAEIEQPAAIVEPETDFDEAAVKAEKKDVRGGDVMDLFTGAGLVNMAPSTNLFTTHGGAGMRGQRVEQRHQPTERPNEEHEANLFRERPLPFAPRVASAHKAVDDQQIRAQRAAGRPVNNVRYPTR
jgi:hypothetical protein